MSKKSTRSKEDAIDLIKSQAAKAEKIDEATVAEAREMLEAVAEGFGDLVLDVGLMRTILQAMIKDTPFAAAWIENRDELEVDDVYQNLCVIMGDYDGGTAYNVWLARENNQWILRFSRVPKRGNWRGDLR